MPEPGVGRSAYLRQVRHHVEARGKQVPPAEQIDVRSFKLAVGEQFVGDLAAADAFTDDRFIAGLVEQANREGLTKQEVAAVIRTVHEQLSVQANFEVRQEYMDRVTTADGIGEKIIASFRQHLREAGAVIGLGMTSDVAERKKQLLGVAEDSRIEDDEHRVANVKAAQRDMRALVESAFQRESMRHRLRNYFDLGGAQFTDVVRKYQSGKFDHQQLFEQAAFTAGLEKIVQGLDIPDGFVLEVGAPPVDIRDEDVKEAIRRHLKFVLRTEIVHLAELQQLDVLSSEAYQAEKNSEIRGGWQRAKAYVKDVGVSVAFSGTTWGMITRVGTKAAVAKLMIGGLIAVHAPAALGIAGGIATGVVAGAAAGIIRERYFNSQDRKKQQRMEAAFGAVDDGVIVSAEVLHDDMVKRAAAIERLQENVSVGYATQAELDSAVKELYAVVADVQVRLLRARAGNDVARDYSEPETIPETTTVAGGHKKKLGHGAGRNVGHGAGHGQQQPVRHGAGQAAHRNAPEAINHAWKVKPRG
ncbi:MAG: hypothetical protein ACD_43C00262G0005, partial [uncultured bacterium]